MPNCHQPLSIQSLSSRLPAPCQLSPVLLFSTIPKGLGYPFVSWEAGAPAVSPPLPFEIPASLAGQFEMLTSPWFSVSAAQKQLKHQCVINNILNLNPKHSIVSAARKKTKSIPANTRILCLLACISEARGIVQRWNHYEKESVFRIICCKAMTDLQWQNRHWEPDTVCPSEE